MEGLNSDLDLNGGASPRVRPRLGEWGPDDVPTTRSKRRGRWWAVTAFAVLLTLVVGLGYGVWTLLT